MGIRFPYLSECHRQIPFLESMSLDYVLCQLVLIKENKTKVFIAQRVMGPIKQPKQIIMIMTTNSQSYMSNLCREIPISHTKNMTVYNQKRPGSANDYFFNLIFNMV